MPIRRSADRIGMVVPVEAQQQQRLGADEGGADQRARLLGGERANRAVAALGVPGHLDE